MDEKHEVRIEAVRRFLAGERPAARIYRSLSRNKQWFYFWLGRYNRDDDNWYRDRPRRNRVIHNKIGKELEILVCNIRKRLAKTKYAQIGALAIQWELRKLGVEPVPTPTINRIIKRNGLVRKPKIYEKRNKIYPGVKVTSSNQMHELDLVGPRYAGKGKSNRFYSFNLIDIFSNVCKIWPYPARRAVFATEFLVSAWQKIGIPKYLQVDNELCFRGSNKYPRTFGDVIKLCLYLGVEIIFVPESEPWRQGVIESFNNVYDKTFFRAQIFEGVDHLKRESLVFEDFHNNNHCYSKLKGKVPWAVHTPVARRTLPGTFALHNQHIPFRDGKVSFVRLTDKEGRARFFTETFLVGKDLVNEYVKGTIFTKPGLLKFYYDNKLVKSYQYRVKKD